MKNPPKPLRVSKDDQQINDIYRKRLVSTDDEVLSKLVNFSLNIDGVTHVGNDAIAGGSHSKKSRIVSAGGSR